MAFCILLICLAAVPLAPGVSDPGSGWDYRVFMGAVQAFDHNQNPYDVANVNQYTGDNLPFTYPPHTLFFFWLLQFFAIFQSIWIYYALLVVLIIAGGYLILTLDNKPDYFFFATLIFTGFISLFWNFITGNKDVLFLFLFSCILTLLVKKKFWQSSILMGLAGAISLITIPFIALYLIIKRSWIERLKYIFLSVGVIAALFILTLWISPSLLSAYLATITGTSSPLYDSGGYNTPSPFSMFGDLLARAGIGGILPLAAVSAVFVCLIGGAAWYCIRKNRQNELALYSLGMLFLFMILPRIKPYDFIILIIPLYFLFKESSYRGKMLFFGLISLLPLFVWYYPWIDPSDSLPYIIDTYPQTISLFLITVLVFLREWYKDRCPSNQFPENPGSRT